MRTRRVPSVRRDRAEVWRTLRFLVAAAAEARREEAEDREARRQERAEEREARRQEAEARRAEDEARRKAEAEDRDARRKAEAEALEVRRKAETEALEARRAEDEARRKAETEALEARRAEDEVRRQAEAEERDARRQAEAEALEARRTEDEARRQAEVKALEARHTEDEARRKAEAEALEVRRQAEAEAIEARRTEDEVRRKAEAEDREARRQAEAEALEARRAEDEARRQAEAEARRKEEAEARETHRVDDLERKRRFDAMIAEGIRKGNEAFETRQRQETEAFAAGHRKIEAALHRLIGDGDERWGRLMEALAEGDLPRILRGIGIEVADLRHRSRVSRNGGTREWDLIADGREATVVVEVKTTLRPEDVRRFRKHMDTFRQWMPDYDRSGKRIHGALAYLSAKPDVLTHAERRGFLLIRVVGSSASLCNSDGFVPARF